MPRALVTNDDGIDSPGLHALAAAARDAGLDVIVAAPAEESSGAGASLTAVRREGRTVVTRRELPGLPGVPAWAVDAQPGHIVVAALNGWFDPAPDVVLSGINHGANVGRAVLHSGTVGAALPRGSATPAASPCRSRWPCTPPASRTGAARRRCSRRCWTCCSTPPRAPCSR